MAEMTPEDMRPSDVITERSKFDPYIGKVVYYPGCDVNIIAGQRYEIELVDFPEPLYASFVARHRVEFKGGRRWIMDPCEAGSGTMFLWESDVIDQAGLVVTVGMPWNYYKFYDDQTITVAP